MKRKRIFGTLAGLLAATSISALAQAASITVNTEADVIDTPECTLREAIASVNQDSVLGGCTTAGTGTIDTVELPAGSYVLSLTGFDDNNGNGDLDVLANLTLNGAGADTTSISAQGLQDNGEPERVLDINPLGQILNVTINGVTVRDGLESDDGGGIRIEGNSNNELLTAKLGVFDGTFTLVTLNGVRVVDNESDDDAGGILNAFAQVVIDDSEISNNISNESGGGLESFTDLEVRIGNSVIDGNTAVFGAGISSESGNLFIDATTISNNSGACVGGGLAIDGRATVTNSTISGNRADGGVCAFGTVDPVNVGGGVALDTTSSLLIANSTISGNFAPNGGGGIAMALPTPAAPAPVTAIKLGQLGVEGLHLNNATIAENSTDGVGGGILTLVIQPVGEPPSMLLTMANSILANNQAGDSSPDCAAEFFSEGYNLIGDTEGCVGFTATGDQTGIDPQLGPLQDNGGPTFTHALLVGSPAIDTANPDGCTDNAGTLLTRDQRGETRPVNATGLATAICDRGAFEFQLPEPTPTPTPTATPGFLLNGTGCALVESAAPNAGPALLALLAGCSALAYRRLRRAE
ncbi:MAG TPA: choice-of-anchor Q domain-containing protein [bacterium]|nr:choice-of-anchor Q domain-containing protein [bacterium]